MSLLSSLPNQHHEELKGPKAAWATTSRRSISWLVYLNDMDWDSASRGGALRTYTLPEGTAAVKETGGGGALCPTTDDDDEEEEEEEEDDDDDDEEEDFEEEDFDEEEGDNEGDSREKTTDDGAVTSPKREKGNSSGGDFWLETIIAQHR